MARFLTVPRLAIGLACIVSATAASVAAENPPSADAIFLRAREAADTPCDARLAYHVVVSATVAGRPLANRFAATFDGDVDALDVARFDDAELAHPAVPHGTNLAITLTLGTGAGLGGGVGPHETGGLPHLSEVLTQKLNRDPPTEELLGVPMLSPTYTFGLRSPSSPNATPEPSAGASPDPSLRTIATATASYLRDYAVTLAGVEPIAGTTADHLRLVPRRDPTRYRLRDVWVDAATDAVLQIVTDGNFVAGPPTRAMWRVVYRDVAGCRAIASETALAPLDYGRDRIYRDTTIVFDYDAAPGAGHATAFVFRRPVEADDLIEPPEGPP